MSIQPSLSLLQGLPITGFLLKESEWWNKDCEATLAAVITGIGFTACNLTYLYGSYSQTDKFMGGCLFAIQAYYVNIVAFVIIGRLADSLNISPRMQYLLDRPISWILTAVISIPFMGKEDAIIALIPITTIVALTSIYDFLTFDPAHHYHRSLMSLLSCFKQN